MVSIIIVNYKSARHLFTCLQSIKDSHPTVKHEIIVVDNDEKKTLYPKLHKKFPWVKYVANKNEGFGQGNNVGAAKARGTYLLFLNPDTKVFLGCIETLSKYLDKNKDTAIAAPLLYGHDAKIVPLQGARMLFPLSAVLSFSFLTKLFPNNKIFRKYWMLDEWDKKSIQEVGSVPGTAFMIRKDVFTIVDGFDEHFFLYFEEHDLCKKVGELGWKLVMHPKARVFHELGVSTRQSKRDVQNIFNQSRYYYLKKHFGRVPALVSEAILRFSKYTALLLGILGIGIFLRYYNLHESMPLIGDQGWFYLSAKEMLTTGQIPLVGIPSSHPWLFQGAFWTYLLAGSLKLFNFNPLAGAYLSALLDVLAIVVIYKLGSGMFSRRVGIIVAALYATSWLVVMNARMPYHTAPIPLFSILFIYLVYRWMQGKVMYFPWTIGVLVILYNFELATFLFTAIFVFLFLFGFIKKEKWVMGVFNKKIFLYSVLAFFIPMLPMLIFDIQHYFGQTFGFVAWLGYKMLITVGYPPINPTTHIPISELASFLKLKATQVIYPYNAIVALGGFSISFVYIVLKGLVQKKFPFMYLSLINVVLLLGLVISRVPSDAYLPMLFPGVMLQLAVYFDIFFKKQRFKSVGVLLVILFMFVSMHYLVNNDFYSDPLASKFSMEKRIDAAKQIIFQSEGKEYNLKEDSKDGAMHPSAVMNFAYLTWWLGHGPSDKEEDLQFFVTEDSRGITITKKEMQ